MGSGQSKQVAEEVVTPILLMPTSKLSLINITIPKSQFDNVHAKCYDTSPPGNGSGWSSFFLGVAFTLGTLWYLTDPKELERSYKGERELKRLLQNLKKERKEKRRARLTSRETASGVTDITNEEKEALEVSRLALAYMNQNKNDPEEFECAEPEQQVEQVREQATVESWGSDIISSV